VARKPDTPCVDCGQLLWSGTGSAPADQRRCRPCRRARWPQDLKSRACVDCGATAYSKGNPPLCRECSRLRRRARDRRRDAAGRGAEVAGRKLTIKELGDRDGWRCHLCKRSVNSDLDAPHPRSATFDHLVPVSKGGIDVPENLMLAHWGCNSRRGNKDILPMLLIG